MKNILLITFIVMSLLLVNVSAAGNNLSLANKINYLSNTKNQNSEIALQNFNKLSIETRNMLGNNSEVKIYQNRYNQSIVSIERQSKFLNLFQWKRNYEYEIVNNTLKYQNKWYDFMWK